MKKSKVFWGYIILALVVYAVVQFLINSETLNFYYQNTLITMCINIMLAVSLHLVIGITGQFSIGHAGFMAIGAYISAIGTMKLELPFITAIILGAVVAMVLSDLIAIIFGKVLSKKFSENVMQKFSGILFLIFVKKSL